MTTSSFPFLKISKKYEVPYSAVLIISDAMDLGSFGLSVSEQQGNTVDAYAKNPHLMADIYGACSRESERRRANGRV